MSTESGAHVLGMYTDLTREGAPPCYVIARSMRRASIPTGVVSLYSSWVPPGIFETIPKEALSCEILSVPLSLLLLPWSL
jgi:hypothetical protein